MPDVPQFVIDRAAAKDPIFSADEVHLWPDELFERLVAEGLLKLTTNAASVVCDACGNDHVEAVVFIGEAPQLRAFIACPVEGRVDVPLDRLKQWTIDKAKLARLVVPQDDNRPEYVFCSQGNFWEVRFDDESGVIRNLNGMTYIRQLILHSNKRLEAGYLKQTLGSGAAEGSVLSKGASEVLGGEVATTSDGSYEVVTPESLKACEDRLIFVQEEQEAARVSGYLERLETLEAEKQEIKKYLAYGRGIRGQPRKVSGKRGVTNAVKQAIQRAIDSLKKANPPLPRAAEYLTDAIVWSDSEFEYRPTEPAPDWKI